MKLSRNSVPLVAAIVLSTVCALWEVTRAEVGVAPVADPDASRVLIWISKKGKETSGRFVRLSGDELLIERDGQGTPADRLPFVRRKRPASADARGTSSGCPAGG